MAQSPFDAPRPVADVDDTSPAEAAPAGSSNAGKAGRAVREIVETLLLAALIFFAVRLVVLNFKVDGASMLPNLQNEEMLLVNKNAYRSFDFDWIPGVAAGDDDSGDDGFYPFSPPERGDIVVFDPPAQSNKPYIKRIIGLPGETVTFGGGSVFVNGTLLEEPYIIEETDCEPRREVCEVLVPDGEIFVLGDNRTNSSDSRVFGPVPVGNVIGKAWFAYWPPANAGLVPHHDYPGIPDSAVAAASPVASPVATGERRDRSDRATRRAERDDAAAPPAP